MHNIVVHQIGSIITLYDCHITDANKLKVKMVPGSVVLQNDTILQFLDLMRTHHSSYLVALCYIMRTQTSSYLVALCYVIRTQYSS